MATVNKKAPSLTKPAGGRVNAGYGQRLAEDAETYAAIRRIADQDHRAVSDVVREAIRLYLEAS